MKHIKKELSFLLVFALVVTSLVVGFGQLSAAAYDDFVGAGILRVDVKVRGDSCDSGPRGTDSSFRLDLLDANGNIVSSSPTLIGFYRPPATTDYPLSPNTWTTYTHDGSNPDNRDVRVTVPGLGNMVVNKHVSQLRFIEVAHENDFIHESIVVYYYDGGTWVEIGRHNYTGNVPQFKGVGDHKIFPTTWFSNNNKTLNFDANGGTGGGTYNAIPNQTIAATEPTGTGYTFDGWSPEVPARMPNADTTYTAQWNPREYSITFDANGGTGGTTASLLCGSSLTPPEVTRAGYSLAGWSPSVPTAVPAADTTYTAIWLENGETNTNIYSITFDPNDGSGNMPVQEVSFGQTTVLADNAFTKAGYSFSGWATSASNADSGATEYLDGADFTLFNDVTLYAVWTPNLYAMTFLSTGGMGATSIYLPYGAPLVPPTVTREGYEFSGWLPSPPATVPAENSTFAAQWDYAQYTITFDAMGGSVDPASKTVTYLGTYGELPTAIKPGFFQNRWSCQFPGGLIVSDIYSTDTVTTPADLTFTASYRAVNYTISYNGNGSTGGSTASSAHGYNIPKDLTLNGFVRPGYTFSGWAESPSGPVKYTDGESVVNLTQTNNATVTLYAKWSANTYTINYAGNDSTDGNTPSSLHTYGFSATLTPNGFVKTGFVFLGWSTDANAVAAEYTDAQNVLNLTTTQGAVITFYAVWGLSPYTITFDTDGGSAVSAVTQGNGTQLQEPVAPVKENFTFGGWYADEARTLPVEWPHTITEDATFYAKWHINSYTIIFDANGGTGGTIAAMPFGSPLTAPTVARSTYTFAGWSPAVPETVPAENTVYTAQWTATTETQYIVTFDALGGTVSPPTSTVTYGSTYAAGTGGLPTPVKSNYIFENWFMVVDGTNIAITDTTTVTIDEAHTIYAKWRHVFGLTVFTSGHFTYTGTTQARISRYSGPSGGHLNIPSRLNGLPVTSLGYRVEGLYDEWPFMSACPATLTLPETITHLDFMAFSNTDALTAIYFLGDAPSTDVSTPFSSNTKIYYLEGRTGYTTPIWKGRPCEPFNGATVTFDADGGTGGTSTVMVPGMPLSVPTVSRPGYVFAGWSPEVPPTVPATDTVYIAQWTANQHLVTFDPDGGSVSPSSKTVTYNSPYGTLPIPTKSISLTNYSFDGWYTERNGAGTQIRSSTIVTITSSQTLYAKWSFSGTPFRSGDFSYIPIMGGTAKIIKYHGPSGGHLTIPETIGGRTVTSIGYYIHFATEYIPFEDASPTALTLPATITYLDSMAFSFTGALTAVYFMGDAPSSYDSDPFHHNTNVYYLAGRTGYTTPTWMGRPCEPFGGINVTFDANGGSGGTSTSLPQGDPLTPPIVSRPGYVFAGWSPAVPATVPTQDTTYTAQYYAMPAVKVTKLADSFKVNIYDWDAANKYQIWSYQQLTGELLGDGTVSRWALSKPYALGASGTAEGDGSISFTIPAFTSADGNYTVAVRIADADNRYLGEIRDTYTPADVSEVKITKVLVDGEYSTGTEVREIKPGASMSFMVIGNGVPGTVCSALVEQPDTPALTANSAIAFTWDIAGMAPGNYTVRFNAGNGATSDTRTVRVQLYSLDAAIQYGRIDTLALTAPDDTALPKTMTLAPTIENGSFYYRVGEPGRKAMFTSGLFDPGNTAEYTFTKYGIYQVASFVNREYEVRIGGFYDDGIIQNFTVRRSDTEPSSVTLTADGVNLNDPIQKSTALTFEANAQIGGIGATPVEYSYWRQDAKGYALVRDWSADNTLEWTAARVGIYVFEVRAKGADAGSYEVAKSVRVTVTDTEEDFARDVVITLNEDDLSAATARVPITLKANATSSNSEDLLYRFHVYDSAMGTRTLQNYSAAQHCVWTPRKAGTYTVSVLVKNQASFGAYDAMQTFTVTVN